MLDTATQARIWAQQAKGISTSAKWVLMMLAFRVNGQSGNFDVWPSHRCIADDAEMSVSSVKNHLNELESNGFIKIIAQFKSDGKSKSSNIYRLQVRMSVQTPHKTVEVDCDVVGADHSQLLAMGSADPQPNFDPPIASTLTDPIANCLPMELLNMNYRNELDHSASDEADGQSKDLQLFEQFQIEDPDARLIETIEQSWKSLSDRYAGIVGIRGIDARRERLALLRASQGKDKLETKTDVWKKIFDNIEKSSFLRGMAPPGRDRREPFRLNFDFVLKPVNFTKILEGGFNDRFSNTSASFDDRTGQKLSPVEEAVRNVDAQLREGAKRREPGVDPRGNDTSRPSIDFS